MSAAQKQIAYIMYAAHVPHFCKGWYSIKGGNECSIIYCTWDHLGNYQYFLTSNHILIPHYKYTSSLMEVLKSCSAGSGEEWEDLW